MKVIKQTKSITMWADESMVIVKGWGDAQIHIPAKNVFQVIRGLISYTQKFYRKAKKKSILEK